MKIVSFYTELNIANVKKTTVLQYDFYHHLMEDVEIHFSGRVIMHHNGYLYEQ